MEKLIAYINNITKISPDATQALMALFSPDLLPADAFFIEEGQYAREIAFLESGCVRAYFVNQEGKEYNKNFFVGPSLIGAYTSLLTDEKNQIAQRALTDCKIWRASFAAIEDLYLQYHDLERLGRKIAEYYFIEKERKELEMALLEARDRYLLFREQYPNLEQEISQYHIASYLGITATQLSRIRRALAET